MKAHVPFTVYLPPELRRDLRRFALEHGVTASSVAANAIARELTGHTSFVPSSDRGDVSAAGPKVPPLPIVKTNRRSK